MSFALRCLVPALVAATTALLVPAVAPAATTRSFDLRVGTKLTPGKARAVGTVRFAPEKRNRVTIRGRVNDICPGDGYGARIFFKVVYRDGTSNGGGAIDERGCQADALPFSWSSLPTKKRVARVVIDFYEFDAETMQIGDFRTGVVLRP